MIGSASLDLLPPDSGDEFETLVADLMAADFDTDTFRHGRSGQADDGVDVFFETEEGEQIGVQCKRVDSLSVRTIRNEIGKAASFSPPLDRYLIVTTMPQDASLQEEFREFWEKEADSVTFDVALHMWDDVERLLATHRDIFQTFYGEYLQQPKKTLHSEGVIAVSREYLDQQEPRDPHTAWQSSFTLAEIDAGYAFERRSSSKDSVTDTLVPAIENGEHRVLHGSSGCGKSTITKQVACKTATGDIPTLFCPEAADVAALKESLLEWIETTDHGVIIIEDGSKSDLEAVFELVEAAEKRSDIGVLIALRTDDWDPGQYRQQTKTQHPGSLRGVEVPPLSEADIEVAYNCYEATTGEDLPVGSSTIANRLWQDEAEPTVLALVHLLLLCQSNSETGIDGGGAGGVLRASAQAVNEGLDTDIERQLAMQAMVLQTSGLPLSREFFDALTTTGINFETIEEGLETLRGKVIFGEGEDRQTKHERWCVAFLESFFDIDGRTQALKRFESSLNSIFSLSDNADLRHSINQWHRREVMPTEIDEEAVANRLSHYLFYPGRKHNQLVDYYGESQYSGLELPDTASPDIRLSQHVWRGEMALQRSGASQGRSDFAWAAEEYQSLINKVQENPALSDLQSDSFLALALTNRSLIKRNQGEIEEAKVDLRRALEIQPLGEKTPAEATTHSSLAHLHILTGEPDQAEREYRKSIAIARKYRAYHKWAKSLGGLSVIYHARGEHERARACNETAQRVFEQFGDLQALARVYSRTAGQLFDQGNQETAIHLMRQTLQLDRQLDRTEQAAGDLMTLGSWAIENENPDAARQYTTEARKRFKQADNERAVAQCDGNLANVAMLEGDFETGIVQQQNVIERLQELENETAVARAKGDLANAYLLAGKSDRASEKFREAAQSLYDVGEVVDGARLLLNAGQMFYQQDRDRLAGFLFNTSMLQLLNSEVYRHALLSLDHIVEIHLGRENMRQATALALQGWLIARREGLNSWASVFLLRYHFAIQMQAPTFYQLIYPELLEILSATPIPQNATVYLEATASGENEALLDATKE